MGKIEIVSSSNMRRKKRVTVKENKKRKLPTWMEDDRAKRFLKRDKICQCEKKPK